MKRGLSASIFARSVDFRDFIPTSLLRKSGQKILKSAKSIFQKHAMWEMKTAMDALGTCSPIIYVRIPIVVCAWNALGPALMIIWP